MFVCVVTRTEPTYCGCGCETTYVMGVYHTNAEAEEAIRQKCLESGRDDRYFNDGMWKYDYNVQTFVLEDKITQTADKVN